MYTEDDLLPLSGLQHLVFCERQWALIHLEQQWAENRLTAEGRIANERSHREEVEMRGDMRIVRGLRLHSLKLGVVGIADVIEFSRVQETATADSPADATYVSGIKGLWRPLPVEYKRGRPKPTRCDEVQLCAQALCLEEMLGISIHAGAIFYGQPRRRTEVMFDDLLRAETERAAVRLHELFNLRRTPTAVYERKCDSCSLLEICKPKSTASPTRSRRYIAAILSELGLSPSSERKEEK
jgi:CRISPR-associated exonuclease Cas4